jgi:hypothetical protein
MWRSNLRHVHDRRVGGRDVEVGGVPEQVDVSPHQGANLADAQVLGELGCRPCDLGWKGIEGLAGFVALSLWASFGPLVLSVC